jgi:hypothetical protein
MKIRFQKAMRVCREFFSAIAEKVSSAHVRKKYRIKITKFKKSKGEAFLVIHNRYSDFDREFVERAFGERMYDRDNRKDGLSIAVSLEDLSLADESGARDVSRITLIRELGLPVALFRIEGGYARDKKGQVTKFQKFRAGVTKVIYPKAFSAMSDDELAELISRELKAE